MIADNINFELISNKSNSFIESDFKFEIEFEIIIIIKK